MAGTAAAAVTLSQDRLRARAAAAGVLLMMQTLALQVLRRLQGCGNLAWEAAVQAVMMNKVVFVCRKAFMFM